MATQLWVPGPVEIHAGVDAGGALIFLGYSERGVEVQLRPAFRPVYTDLGGDMVPTDHLQMGEDAVVTAEVKLHNPDVYAAMAVRVRGSSRVRGAAAVGDVGTLMVTEGQAYRLLIYPKYAAKSSMSAGVKAYNFPAAWLIGPDRLPLALKEQTLGLAWYCQPAFQLDGSYVLYNHTTTGKPTAA